MDQRRFWDLVESSKADADGSFGGHVEQLTARLAERTPEDVVAFGHLYSVLMDRAYSWDLWGAAYVIHGGCSDDGFTDFRSWLISLGCERFERALSDPDSLAGIELGPDGEEDASFEEFGYIANQVYEEMTGDELPGDPQRTHPSEPSGERWEEDEDELSARYPKLWSKYGEG